MKRKFLPSIIALVVLSGNAMALTPVKETFSGNSVNKTRWLQYKVGNGVLAARDKKLSFFTKGGGTKDDYSAIELRTSQPGYNENWVLTLDLANTANPKNPDPRKPRITNGIIIFNTQDRNDYLFLNYYGASGVSGGVILNGDYVKDASVSRPLAPTKGTVRLTYNKQKKLLTLEVSPIPAKGKPHDWFTVGTFSPTGKGGTINADWQMDPGSGRFGVQLFGSSASKKVAQKKVTFDNLVIAAKP